MRSVNIAFYRIIHIKEEEIIPVVGRILRGDAGVEVYRLPVQCFFIQNPEEALNSNIDVL